MTVETETLFDAAARARDEAIAQVDEHAAPEWKDAALTFLHAYLVDHETMHVDDLWAAGLEEPHELRALGALFQRAARAGWMCKTGRSRPSVRSHLSDKPIWQSLIWGDATNGERAVDGMVLGETPRRGPREVTRHETPSTAR